MRERYRNMMERETLRSETKSSILKRMEWAENQKTDRHPLRAALIAACLCLTLAGTTFTAIATDGFGLLNNATFKEDGSYALEVNTSLKLYAVDVFSPTLQEDMAAAGRADQILPIHLESWQETLDYVAVPLPENTLLDNRELFQDGNADSIWRLWLDLHPGLVHFSRSYEVDGILVKVDTGIFTEQYDGRHIVNDGVPFWWNYFELNGDGKITANAEYDNMFHGVITVAETWMETMADGTSVLFIQAKDQDSDRCWYGASFVYDGIAYAVFIYDAEEVRAWLQGYDPQKTSYNPDLDYEGVLRLVIDGFTFE